MSEKAIVQVGFCSIAAPLHQNYMDSGDLN